MLDLWQVEEDKETCVGSDADESVSCGSVDMIVSGQEEEQQVTEPPQVAKSSTFTHQDMAIQPHITQCPTNCPRAEVTKRNAVVTSTEAKALAFILNIKHSDSKIQMVNKIKSRIKDYPSADLMNQYKEIITPIQCDVLKQISSLKEKIHIWEEKFMLQNELAAPMSEDFPQNIVLFKKRLQQAKMLVETVWCMDIL